MPLHSSLPQIEGFQPIPNAVMIPFMEAQSAALAYGFGLNYEYGKRKIRSMSNDEYNSLTSEDITNMTNAHTHIILSQFQLQVPKVMPMQKEIFNQYVIIEKEKILQNVALLKWITANAPQILIEGKTPGSSIKEDVSQKEFDESLNKPFGSKPSSPKGPGKQSPHIVNTNKQQIPQGFQIINGQISKIPIQTQQGKVTQKLPSVLMQYNTTKTILLKRVTDFKKLLLPMTTSHPHYITTKATLEKHQKVLMNFITHGKNVSATKAQANQDWNNKIWK